MAPQRIRVAAAGDVHAAEAHRQRLADAFTRVRDQADVILLAGDLTTHGEPEQAEVLADACRLAALPVVAVLGNHDYHENRADELVEVLRRSGVTVLVRDATVVDVSGTEIGIVGTKGFVGGFAPSHLPDFGEPSLREVYAEAGRDVEALDRGLRAVATCPFRIVLLHYAPCEQTLQGERREIFVFLGTDRLAAPILEHGPDLVLHGHAHAGTVEGRIGEVPVYNVSVPVIGRDFWRLELTSTTAPTAPIH